MVWRSELGGAMIEASERMSALESGVDLRVCFLLSRTANRMVLCRAVSTDRRGMRTSIEGIGEIGFKPEGGCLGFLPVSKALHTVGGLDVRAGFRCFLEAEVFRSGKYFSLESFESISGERDGAGANGFFGPRFSFWEAIRGGYRRESLGESKKITKASFGCLGGNGI